MTKTRFDATNKRGSPCFVTENTRDSLDFYGVAYPGTRPMGLKINVSPIYNDKFVLNGGVGPSCRA